MNRTDELHATDLTELQHPHRFMLDHSRGERRTRWVLLLTVLTMVAEIVAGTLFGSMALLADGWHMATHVAAFLIALFAYRYARQHAENPAFSFGTGKVNVLGGFASAVALGAVCVMMIVESVQRLFTPHSIMFDEAILVAILGLLVNLVSALLLHNGNDHHHHDHNLRAAYLHVLADALTSVLAIAALTVGKLYGQHWLDPVIGIVGAIIIARWSLSLLRETSPVLLDASVDREHREAIRESIESDRDNRIYDMHIWRIGARHYAAIVGVVTDRPAPVKHYKELLQDFDWLSHITIEVTRCTSPDCHSDTR